MKILIIHNRYSVPGGEEKVVELQRKILSERGNDVSVYIRDYHESDSMCMGRVRSFFSSLYSNRSIDDIRQIIGKQKPDVAIIHNLYPLISPAIIRELKKNGIAVAMTVHNYRLFCPIGLFFSKGRICLDCVSKCGREFHCIRNRCEGTLAGSTAFAIRNYWSRLFRFYRGVDMFLSVSEFQKNNLVRYGIPEDRISVLHNCTGEVRETPAYGTGKYVGYVGRVSEEKGIDLLFGIAERMPDTEFRIAGSISPGYRLPEAPDNIRFVGHLSGAGLRKFYEDATAILFTSRVWEAMPLTTLEAMALGKVVVASNISSLPEIIEDGTNGYLFGTPDEAIEKLRSVMENSDRNQNLGNAALETIRSGFSEQIYSECLTRILSDIISRK